MTREPISMDFNASIAAVNSISLAVVLCTAPEMCHRLRPEERIAAQPPGPGFPIAEPSVTIWMCFRISEPLSPLGDKHWLQIHYALSGGAEVNSASNLGPWNLLMRRRRGLDRVGTWLHLADAGIEFSTNLVRCG